LGIFYEKDTRNHRLVIYTKNKNKIKNWVTHYPTQPKPKISGFI